MKQSLTEIIFLLDRSGSMGGLEKNTINGFNAFIESQSQVDGETTVTAVLFDDEYEILWNGIDAKKVTLTNKEYYVRGSTALLDAVGKTILDVGYRLSKTTEDERPGKVIFVITTDGMENSSREFTYEKIKDLIKHQQEKYNWEFIFLGANIDATIEAGNIGIDISNAYNFEASETGVETMYNMVCDAVFEKRMSKNEK
ncbi:vWA domain-containing protein [Anaerobacillus isosaccharinicus]|uniref:VWA domain-containing protein n=1 Tax=Anaerobacillus isosaccharinicus TaxID=1532552 RepID=A0A1S2LF55_9BACI|nr:vWA domain-containing protein [Anaerobacillus isosaccharinicus]MBA5586299.1 VWA domain-containing protein [Anaerobacillus isosaccharinicus]QOY35451.1 VWA domain-containing protein [Anaerobacillus isosaccharinicus]